MYKLASCWLRFVGCLTPLFSLPMLETRQDALQLSAPDEDARSILQELEKAFFLQRLREVLGAEGADGLRKADPGTNVFNPTASMRKAFSEQDSNVLLNHLLARTRRQSKERGPPSECFWKYCV